MCVLELEPCSSVRAYDARVAPPMHKQPIRQHGLSQGALRFFFPFWPAPRHHPVLDMANQQNTRSVLRCVRCRGPAEPHVLPCTRVPCASCELARMAVGMTLCGTCCEQANNDARVLSELRQEARRSQLTAAACEQAGFAVLQCRVPGLEPDLMVFAHESMQLRQEQMAAWSEERKRSELEQTKRTFNALRGADSAVDYGLLALQWFLLEPETAPYGRCASTAAAGCCCCCTCLGPESGPRR